MVKDQKNKLKQTAKDNKDAAKVNAAVATQAAVSQTSETSLADKVAKEKAKAKLAADKMKASTQKTAIKAKAAQAKATAKAKIVAAKGGSKEDKAIAKQLEELAEQVQENQNRA